MLHHFRCAAGDGTQLSTNPYVRPDAGQLGILAAAVAAGTLHLAASPIDLANAPGVARGLANGQAAGPAHVITPRPRSGLPQRSAQTANGRRPTP